MISGTPTAVTAPATYVVRAANSGGGATASLVLAVVEPPGLVLTGETGGPSRLGSVTRLPLDLSSGELATTSWTGKPYPRIFVDAADGGFVWNPRDARFYAILPDGGPHETGVLLAFDPATDAVEVLSVLSSRRSPGGDGPGGTRVKGSLTTGFHRVPVVTPDGSALIALAESGGKDGRGSLVHVDIDPSSAAYLRQTTVYDFFSYEMGTGTYCDSLRDEKGGGTRLSWGVDGTGAAVLYLARTGLVYQQDPRVPHFDETHPQCPPAQVVGCRTLWQMDGKAFTLRPTDPADLSRPWEFGRVIHAQLARNQLLPEAYFDVNTGTFRWSTEEPGAEITLYANDVANDPFILPGPERCNDGIGMAPMTSRDSFFLCGGRLGFAGVAAEPSRAIAFRPNGSWESKQVFPWPASPGRSRAERPPASTPGRRT